MSDQLEVGGCLYTVEEISQELIRLQKETRSLGARLEKAETLCQLPAMDGTVTACACCGARGIPERKVRPHHSIECPFREERK